MEIFCHRRRPPLRSYSSQRSRRAGRQRSRSSSSSRRSSSSSSRSSSSQGSMEISCCRSRYISQRRRRGGSQRSNSTSSPRRLVTAGVSMAAATISWVLARMQVLGGGPTISSSIRCSI